MIRRITIEVYANGIVLKNDSSYIGEKVYNESEALDALTDIYRLCFKWSVGDIVRLEKPDKSMK